MNTPNNSPPRSVPRLLVPALVAGIMGACLLSTGALIVVSGADRSFAVEPDYYAKALAWDRARLAEARSRLLGWCASAAFDGPDLVVSLRDRDGDPVRASGITAEVFTSARASQRWRLSLNESAPGEYRAPLPAGAAGAWIVRLSASTGTDRFVASFTLSRHASTEGAR